MAKDDPNYRHLQIVLYGPLKRFKRHIWYFGHFDRLFMLSGPLAAAFAFRRPCAALQSL